MEKIERRCYLNQENLGRVLLKTFFEKSNCSFTIAKLSIEYGLVKRGYKEVGSTTLFEPLQSPRSDSLVATLLKGAVDRCGRCFVAQNSKLFFIGLCSFFEHSFSTVGTRDDPKKLRVMRERFHPLACILDCGVILPRV